MNAWKPTTYLAKTLEEKINSGEIQVPTYQRGIVWSGQKQKKSVNSLKFGYPFGSILLYDDKNKRSRLQRRVSKIISLDIKSTNLFSIKHPKIKAFKQLKSLLYRRLFYMTPFSL